MSSYFSESHHIESLSSGYDLAKDQMDEADLADIGLTIADDEDVDMGDLSTVLALEAINEALGEHDDALLALANYDGEGDESLILLRTAQHLRSKGDVEESDRCLDTVIERAAKGGGTGRLTASKPPVLDRVCALIAHGRKADKDTFIESWYESLEMSGIRAPPTVEKILENPSDFSLFRHLPTREWLEGIGYLQKYEIREYRDAEILCLVNEIRYYLEGLVSEMTFEGKSTGFTEPYPAFRVVFAFSNGGLHALSGIRSTKDLIAEKAVSDAVDLACKEIRNNGIRGLLMDTFMVWSFHPKQPIPELIETLREQAGGNDLLIAEIADNMGREFPVGSLAKIYSLVNAPPEYYKRIPGKERIQKKEQRWIENWEAMIKSARH
ncbi:MAG: hypothetical protein PHF57_04685 [Methanoregula sp.]|jgi:hypothetical protein|nr:hypothetical protein [Methanoregula sp.]MDD5187486.1 hypothetical protein [Methanoregula sp.]